MHTLRCLALLSFFLAFNQACNNTDSSVECNCNATASDDTTDSVTYKTVKGALLGTRFSSLEELKSVIQIEYHPSSDTTTNKNAYVSVRHCSGGKEVSSILQTGISEGDLHKAGYSDVIWDQIALLFRSPYAVTNRKDLEKVFVLSRWKPIIFGDGDLAFFDIAKAAVSNINTPDMAFRNVRDSTEKGYFNSFNHITAQALITSCFSEKLADFIADVHERNNCPELITGKFTEAQIKNLGDGPLDNYIDLINNEWGQEIGKQLKEKYSINSETNWTPELLANYMNDLQSYFSWSFQIGFKPFRPDDKVLIRFSSKLNAVMGNRFKFIK
ncbi:MAG: hypothetical protein RIR11_2154 [Bacteroidota bacterium]|jgi:hypothetical protein